MLRIKPVSVVFLFIVLASFKSDNPPANFTALLTRAQLTFTPPEGMVEVPIVKNGQMNYEYALKSKDKAFEVRYTIRPLDSMLMRFAEQEKNKKPGDVNISPNNYHAGAFMATVMNIGGGKLPQIKEFDPGAVKNEFNADWGATTFCIPAHEFAGDYKYCMAITIHKENVADAYCFFLSDTQENYQTLLAAAFHGLRFK